jgi:hypothetical protein
MKRVEFSNSDEYLSFIETLLKNEVTEIIKEPNEEYYLKIDQVWYKIFYSMLIGTDFKQGKTLFLLMGFDRFNYEIDYVRQITDPRIGEIFNTLNDLYIKHLVVNHENVKNSSLSLAEFFNSCDSMEKLHDSIFIITKGGRKFYLKASIILKENRLVNQIGIWRLEDEKQTLINKLEGTIAISIIDFLNFAYYVSRNRHIDMIKESLIDSIK